MNKELFDTNKQAETELQLLLFLLIVLQMHSYKNSEENNFRIDFGRCIIQVSAALSIPEREPEKWLRKAAGA